MLRFDSKDSLNFGGVLSCLMGGDPAGSTSIGCRFLAIICGFLGGDFSSMKIVYCFRGGDRIGLCLVDCLSSPESDGHLPSRSPFNFLTRLSKYWCDLRPRSSQMSSSVGLGRILRIVTFLPQSVTSVLVVKSARRPAIFSANVLSSGCC